MTEASKARSDRKYMDKELIILFLAYLKKEIMQFLKSHVSCSLWLCWVASSKLDIILKTGSWVRDTNSWFFEEKG